MAPESKGVADRRNGLVTLVGAQSQGRSPADFDAQFSGWLTRPILVPPPGPTASELASGWAVSTTCTWTPTTARSTGGDRRMVDVAADFERVRVRTEERTVAVHPSLSQRPDSPTQPISRLRPGYASSSNSHAFSVPPAKTLHGTSDYDRAQTRRLQQPASNPRSPVKQTCRSVTRRRGRIVVGDDVPPAPSAMVRRSPAP